MLKKNPFFFICVHTLSICFLVSFLAYFLKLKKTHNCMEVRSWLKKVIFLLNFKHANGYVVSGFYNWNWIFKSNFGIILSTFQKRNWGGSHSPYRLDLPVTCIHHLFLKTVHDLQINKYDTVYYSTNISCR